MERRRDAARALVRGQLTLMFTIGLATGLPYTVLGLPSALLARRFAGIMEGIPLVGPAIGAIPAIVIARDGLAATMSLSPRST
jgi:predicted PurR-regulated permease PerM